MPLFYCLQVFLDSNHVSLLSPCVISLRYPNEDDILQNVQKCGDLHLLFVPSQRDGIAILDH